MGSSPPPATDDDRYQDPMWERRTHARILVRDADAGRIIGSAGSSIAAMEKEAGSGARITLSGRDQILAGTDRRVVFLSGPFRAVMDAADLLLHKTPPRYQGEQADNTVVLVVPYACCGALIGKGGTLIKWLAQESNAGITVSHHRLCYGFNDRLVNITGRLEHQLQAIFLILSELLDDVQYLSSYQSVGFPRYHVSSIGRDGDGQDEHVERYHSRPDTPVGSADVDDGRDVQGTLTIAVASEYVGAVIGRGGRVIKEIQQGYGRVDHGVQGEALTWDEGKGGGDQRDAGGGGCRGGDDRGAHLVRHGSPRTEAGWRGEEAFPFVKPVE
ncbi:unnamed protein product [Triticum turgidum subsp. durum]|uniref:K Homology domain-containing protein n=1 Tax=Triticum turgidum subsp. durum TaxID=4567 RepID=A0A9R1BUV8_TRITD|nr:unnamed protein product [Triticum turgidum subsp. durum]